MLILWDFHWSKSTNYKKIMQIVYIPIGSSEIQEKISVDENVEYDILSIWNVGEWHFFLFAASTCNIWEKKQVDFSEEIRQYCEYASINVWRTLITISAPTVLI